MTLNPRKVLRTDGRTGLEPVGQFSFFALDPSDEVLVPTNQEMIVSGRIDNGGRLVVDGRIIQGEIDEPDQAIVLPPDNFGYFAVASGQTVRVPASQEMAVSTLDVSGRLEVDGRVSLEIAQPDDDVQEEVPWTIDAGKTFVIKDAFSKLFFQFELAGSLILEGRARLIVGG